MTTFEPDRRDPRYVAHVELHVAHGGRHLVTLSREMSRSGLFFFADPTPGIGDQVRITLYPDACEPFGIDTMVRYTMPGVGAGVAVLDRAPGEAARYRAFVEDRAQSSETWRLIGGFVRSAEEGDTSSDVEFEPKEMIDVGESCEAFRVFFERYPPVAPELSLLRDDIEAVAHAKAILVGLSSDPVGIKLHARDRLRRALLGVLARASGYVAIVRGPRGGKSSFYSLSGREQLMIQEGGRPVFPFFTASDLARIKRDKVSAVDSGRRRSLSVLDHAGSISLRYAKARAETSPAALARWTRFVPPAAEVVHSLFDILGAETRVYTIGNVERPVRLLRNVAARVREGGQGEGEEAMLLHDGNRVCVIFGLGSRTPMRIRPLTEHDEIRLPAW